MIALKFNKNSKQKQIGIKVSSHSILKNLILKLLVNMKILIKNKTKRTYQTL